jgi:hypothetical protein
MIPPPPRWWEDKNRGYEPPTKTCQHLSLIFPEQTPLPLPHSFACVMFVVRYIKIIYFFIFQNLFLI